MKKQLLIAAVAATMATVSIADVSISGSGKINYTNTDTTGADSVNTFTNELDLNITGKSGDNTIFLNIENLDANGTGALNTKTAYMSSKVGDINVKVGSWYGADSLLGNGGAGNNRFSADTTIGGVKIQYENQEAGDESVTLSGTVAGISISHESHQDGDTDTSVSGSFGGVNATYRSWEQDIETSTATDKTSIEVSTEVQGVTLTYAAVENDGTGTTTSDAFFGTFATAVNDLEGFGLKTTLAGNTVQLKSYDVKEASTSADDSYTKLVVTRALASGATAELTYTSKDDAGTADVDTLDLELFVKF